MINSHTKLFAVIGKPSRHSLSPVMHNAGFQEMGLNCVYLVFEPENLKKTIQGFRELEVSGFNLTMPFKEEVMDYLDIIDPVARSIGAVNTVIRDNKRLVGYNTDGLGAINSLKRKTQLQGKNVLLIGTGGAARAIAFYLAKEKAKVSIAGRTQLKAIKLAKITRQESVVLNTLENGADFDIIINATPVGMAPNEKSIPINTKLLREGLIVFDIVYDPVETMLLREAKRRRCITIDGLDMLLNQGFVGFELFTGKKAPERVMRITVMNNLGK